MPNSNQKSKPFLIFPEDSASIIKNILKKHGLQESSKELLEKWKRAKKGFGGILADLIVKTSKENLSSSELANLVKKELNISSQKAQSIARALDKEIFAPAAQVTEETSPEKKLFSIGELLFPNKKG